MNQNITLVKKSNDLSLKNNLNNNDLNIKSKRKKKFIDNSKISNLNIYNRNTKLINENDEDKTILPVSLNILRYNNSIGVYKYSVNNNNNKEIKKDN